MGEVTEGIVFLGTVEAIGPVGAGAGMTVVLGRKAYGTEISPIYCDLIIKRWEDFTGKKAVLSEL